MKNEVKKILEKIILDNYEIEIKDLKLDIPPKKELWDFAFGWFQLARDLKKSPAVIVSELKKLIENEKQDLIDSSEVEWPYLNIKLNKARFTEDFLKFIKFDVFEEERKVNQGKTIIIDYIWANVWKPLHIGHMCTPTQGQVMIEVYKKLWYKVISDSHIGDWGIIFWKLITAHKLWPDEKKLKENAVEHLFNLYVKITTETEKEKSLEQKTRDEFKLLSEWNPESIELWKNFTKFSIKAMNKELNRFHIKPDYNIWESFYEWLWFPKMEDYPDLEFDMKWIVKDLISKKIATKNEDNSVWIVFYDAEKIPSCILQKRDWTHWYLASDLAAIKYRKQNWNPEKIIYFVDIRQQLHLKQAFIIAKKAGWINDTELFHAANGFISLKDWAMSTRKGKIIRLDKLLDEAEERAKKIILEKRDDINGEELKELSIKIWIWAIKYGYLKKSRETDVIFDWDEFMTFEGNSGPYIQYAYVRAIRIIEKSWLKIPKELKWDFENDEEIQLVKKLMVFKSLIKKSTEENTPHLICQYSYELTKTFNSFYNSVHILNEEVENKKFLRLVLVKKFSETIKDCFSLLGIKMPERM